MNSLKSANLALAFVLELCVLAALAYWGYTTAATNGTVLQIGLCILLPVIGIGVWAIWGAPQSKRRLTGAGLLVLRVVFFGIGALALVLAGQTVLGVVLGLISALNIGLIYAWRQDTKVDSPSAA